MKWFVVFKFEKGTERFALMMMVLKKKHGVQLFTKKNFRSPHVGPILNDGFPVGVAKRFSFRRHLAHLRFPCELVYRGVNHRFQVRALHNVPIGAHRLGRGFQQGANGHIPNHVLLDRFRQGSFVGAAVNFGERGARHVLVKLGLVVGSKNLDLFQRARVYKELDRFPDNGEPVRNVDDKHQAPALRVVLLNNGRSLFNKFGNLPRKVVKPYVGAIQNGDGRAVLGWLKHGPLEFRHVNVVVNNVLELSTARPQRFKVHETQPFNVNGVPKIVSAVKVRGVVRLDKKKEAVPRLQNLIDLVLTAPICGDLPPF